MALGSRFPFFLEHHDRLSTGYEVGLAGLNNPFSVRFLKFHASVFCAIAILIYFPATQRFGLALLFWTFSLWVTAHCLAFSWLRHPKQFVPLPDLGHRLIGEWSEVPFFHIDAGLVSFDSFPFDGL